MTTCWACDTKLQPEWKFCIHCGVPVEEDSGTVATPSDTDQLSPLAIFGWIFASIGVAVLIIGVILYFLAR